MKKIEIISSVEEGNLRRNRKLIKKAIESFEGAKITLTIQKYRKSRSTPQNRFYWGVCIPILQEGLYDATGEVRDANSIHYNVLLPMFAPTRDIINKETGEVFGEKITSSEMSTTEFAEYVNDIQNWATEFLNVTIPDPNSEIKLEFD